MLEKEIQNWKITKLPLFVCLHPAVVGVLVDGYTWPSSSEVHLPHRGGHSGDSPPRLTVMPLIISLIDAYVLIFCCYLLLLVWGGSTCSGVGLSLWDAFCPFRCFGGLLQAQLRPSPPSFPFYLILIDLFALSISYNCYTCNTSFFLLLLFPFMVGKI